MLDWLLASLAGFGLGMWVGMAPPPPGATAPQRSQLDRIAVAVEGVESSYGLNPAMWQRNGSGPQGPMQVSRAAALDVGGGNRFDLHENRQIGRAYLAAMHRRYGNWVDALAAYNWGPTNLDRWISSGRSPGILGGGVRVYIQRVLRELGGTGAQDSSIGVLPPARLEPAAPVINNPVINNPVISNPRLRASYERNTDAIRELQAFTAGHGDLPRGRELISRVAKRPGYEQFRTSLRAGARQPSTDNGSLQSIAKVLLEKLAAENAAIRLVDRQRSGTLR